jgi:4-hydroxybenzoyl-CoA reductase subunit beta
MLCLPTFQYLKARSVDEACIWLKEFDGKAKVVAGGTDLLPSMKQRLFAPQYLIDLRGIEGLQGITESREGEVSIGALTVLRAVEESEVVKKYFPGLAQAAGGVAATQIRNMGTIGGNIALETRCWYFNQSSWWRKSFEPCIKRGGTVCHVVKGGKSCYACFAADTVPMLIALGAQVTIQNAEGERQCALRSLYTQDGKSPLTLSSTDLVTRITIPVPKGKTGSAYHKARIREAIDYPLVGAAVQLVFRGSECEDISVVLGAVGSGPIVVEEAVNLVRGKEITEDIIGEVSSMAEKAAKPVTNMMSSPAFRRKMAGILTGQSLREAWTRGR